MNRLKNLIVKTLDMAFSIESTFFLLCLIFIFSIYDLLNKFWFGVSVFIVFFVYFIVTLYLKNKNIRSVVEFVEKRLERFSEGDFNVLLYSAKENDHIVSKVNDNLIKLTNRFESIVSTLKGIARNIKDNSYRIDDQLVVNIYDAKNQIEGIELTAKLSTEVKELIEHIHEEVKNLSVNTDKTVKYLENIFNQNEDIRVIVESLSMYIQESKDAMNQIQRNTRKVTENTENLSSLSLETFSAITELESTFKEISKYIDYTQNLTRDIIAISQYGLNQSKETMASVEKVADVLNTFVLKTNMLKEQSARIERIVDAISRIGERTNLLALNATIFSHNIDERPQDFEVITEKIMELSESSTIALKEISQLIVSFENIILELNKIGEEGSIAMEKALKNVYKNTENFSDISNRLTEIGHHFYSISTASNEHSLGTQQVRDAAHQISNLAEDIANLMSAEDKVVSYVGTKTSFVAELVESIRKSVEIQSEKVQEFLKELREVETSTRKVLRESEELELNNSITIDSLSNIEDGLRKNFKSVLTMSKTSINLKKYGEYLEDTIEFFRLPHRFHGGTLRVGGLNIPFEHFDPAFSDTIFESQILDVIYSGLVKYNYLSNIVPDLCTHWEISDDGLRYTFYLKKNVIFHNGQVFTSADVLATFKRLFDKKVNSTNAGLFFVIKGAREFNRGEVKTLDGIKIIDDYTVEFILEKPLVFFLDLLTLTAAKIIPQSDYHSKKRAVSLIGTGPFRVDIFKKDREIVLSKFKEYFVHNRPFLDRLIFDVKTGNERNLLEMFKNGMLDFVFAGDDASLYTVEEFGELKGSIETIPQVSTYFLAFNCRKKPFDNKRIRYAINIAIDRNRIVSYLPENYALPAYTVIPPSLFSYFSAQTVNYQPDEAIRILKEEGFDFDRDLIELTYAKKGDSIPEDILAVKMCLEDIGIKVKLNPLAKHWEYIARREFDMFRVGWIADYPDPDNFIFTIFNSNAGDPFYISYVNSEIDRLSEDARYEIEPRTRAKLYATIEKIILEESPVIPLYHRKNIVLRNNQLQGVKLKGFSPQVDFSEISFRSFN